MDLEYRKKFSKNFFGEKHSEIVKLFLLDKNDCAIALFWKPIEADDWIDDVYILKEKMHSEYPNFPEKLEVWISTDRIRICKVNENIKVIKY